MQEQTIHSDNPHPHAALMMEYAKDAQKTNKPWELWEVKLCNEEWCEVATHPSWNPEYEYRRKPATRKIKVELEMPLCVTSADQMQRNQLYYIPVLRVEGNKCYSMRWDGDEEDMKHLKSGLVYLNPEDADKHAELLMSIAQL